ncbi:MAG: DUF3253 domain-containing protein [Hoeflea sp.]|uniref:DUF3253 domain-containing protein n=1 Tax=Hoeflea sp. TaxID=1940281 RepID=UPI001D853575|nr:DUF3253 domain-containing protein [Hoeflea sp.]MBU4529676.1 DUF3253 domain-containing protein [Alphaproteobacteria bacterium]MBU4546795.1 DUF3253 domain-containing protein [Alphaproteobacteria bacterium]MBU4551063.1 DUF3253 domain-containing protein [Alphaproteobacteria bacterium]MBV1724005.1 DUF3253 domain-containing protein [Hoeflea sp.]MBV1763282.1 DUF3253 domain-containing protein [Hoeflea sp.]
MTQPTSPRPVPGAAALRAAILDLLNAAGPGKSISPFDAARALVGSDEKQWSRLMKPLRAVAVDMAKAGEVEIRRKGKIVDPAGFRGVYRLALPGLEPGQDTA